MLFRNKLLRTGYVLYCIIAMRLCKLKVNCYADSAEMAVSVGQEVGRKTVLLRYLKTTDRDVVYDVNSYLLDCFF